jgi:cytochrome c oxidase subunit 2
MERWLGLPPDFSTHGAQLDYLLGIVHWVMLILFVGWGAFFVYTLFRFRAGRNPQASYAGARSHFSTYGEAGVAVIEAVLLVGFAVPIWAKRVNAPPPESQSVVMRVVAEQFAWNVHYPGRDGKFGRTAADFVSTGTNPLGLDPNDPAGKDDVTTLNQLHIPVNKPVLIYLTSKDVIHSFFLPYMRVKQDAIPGMSIPVYFTATKTGDWEIACAQLCGNSHYRMRGFFSVHSDADYQKWLAENAPQTAAAPAPAGAGMPADTPATGAAPEEIPQSPPSDAVSASPSAPATPTPPPPGH